MKLLMDEVLWALWPEGKSQTEPERLIWSSGLRIEDALVLFCFVYLFGTKIAKPHAIQSGLGCSDADARG